LPDTRWQRWQKFRKSFNRHCKMKINVYPVYTPVVELLSIVVHTFLRDWTVFSFRSTKVSLLSNKFTGNWQENFTLFETFFYINHLCNRNSDKKSVICIYFLQTYWLENARYTFQFWQSNVWLLSFTIIIFFFCKLTV
jgi:hypothetical protein